MDVMTYKKCMFSGGVTVTAVNCSHENDDLHYPLKQFTNEKWQ